MANWIITASDYYLAPLYQLLKETIQEESVLHADETPYLALESEASQNYFWVLCTPEGAKRSIALYHFNESRSGRVIKKLLYGFRGYLQSDGYAAYLNLSPKVQHVGCLAHIRRKFFEASCQQKGPTKSKEVVELCDQLFKVERKIR